MSHLLRLRACGPRRSLRPIVGPRSRSIPGIEGLRAIAAAMVVVHHVHLWSVPQDERVGGRFNTLLFDFQLGVTLFFALSAFLLYRPFVAAALDGRAVPSIGRFFARRATRILPAYWVIFLAALALGTANLGANGRLDLRDLLQGLTLTQQFTPSTLGVGLGPAWSLVVEAVFYIALPLLSVWVVRAAVLRSPRRRTVVALAPAAFVLFVGLSGKFVASNVVTAAGSNGFSADWHSVILRSFWAQADLFTFGLVLSVIAVLVERGDLKLPAWRAPATLGVVVALALPVGTLGSDGLDASLLNTVGGLVAALVLSLVVLPWAAGDRSWLGEHLDRRWPYRLGLISYSVFLWNEQVIRWLAEVGVMQNGVIGFAFNLVFAFAVVGALSALTYRLVEKPALDWLARRLHARTRLDQYAAAP